MKNNIMGNKYKICIMMATYNGGEFISEQIDSIQKQNFSDWMLLIRDDGSSDNTINIISEYSRLDSRIQLLKDNQGRLGVSLNFNRLMIAGLESESTYFCFSDQDDFWNSDKLEKMLSELALLESKYGQRTPVLVHSDLSVVDVSLHNVSNSFFTYQGLAISTGNFIGQLMVQNVVTGCATMFNRSLLVKSLPVPAEAVVHDWWLALCAASYGHLSFIPKPLVKYRQHGRNQIGAVGFWGRNNVFKKFFYMRIAKSKDNFLNAVSQSDALLHHLNPEFCNNDVFNKVKVFSQIPKFNLIKRVFTFHKLKLHRSSLLGTVSLFFRIVFI